MVVLVVDDAVFMRMVLRNILLKDCGVDKENIQEAGDGSEAVIKYKQLKPEIVFLDVHMPGMDGVDTVRAIMKIDPEAKIVMCTATGHQNYVVDCINAGAKDYIKKPPTSERVVRAVELLTGRAVPPKQTKPAGDDEFTVRFDDFDDLPEYKPSPSMQLNYSKRQGEIIGQGAVPATRNINAEESIPVMRQKVDSLKEDMQALKVIVADLPPDSLQELKAELEELRQAVESIEIAGRPPAV